MSEIDSVSGWILRLKAGDDEAAQEIWTRYVERLIRVACLRLADTPKRMADEDDVVIRAFTSFLNGINSGKFKTLSDRHDLWQILVMLTERQAIDLARAERAKKRGAGRVRSMSTLTNAHTGLSIECATDPMPTPEFALQASEELAQLLSMLDDKVLESVAIWRLEGLTNQEIAKRLGRSESTVERKLKLIRECWLNTV